jgi:hypothetical protein
MGIFLVFLHKSFCMKRIVVLLIVLNISQALFAQDTIGPEGDKLLWGLGIVVVFVGLVLITSLKKGNNSTSKRPLIKKRKVKVELGKDSLYYPDNLVLKIKNSGNSDVDLDQPLLVFDNFWLKRKFRLKGTGNRIFYPLYLEKDKTHTLQIDLTRFYSHDKSLKKYPKAKVSVFDVQGKRLGSKSVFLRKTLFKF